MSLLGNITILFVSRTDLSLHEPMYQFPSMLATTTSLGLSPSTMPTVMSVFWFDARQVSLDICFAQYFLIHSSSFLESLVLLAMAFDLYVAVSYLRKYSSILSSARTGKIGLAALCRCALPTVCPFVVLKGLPFCQCHVPSHADCIRT